MWNDVVIGSGETLSGAVKLWDVGKQATISVNSTSYWIHDAYLGGGMTIFKGTPESLALKDLLDSEAPDDVMLAWLENTFLNHVSNDRLKSLVQSALRRAEREARRKKAKDIRKAFSRAFAKIEEY